MNTSNIVIDSPGTAAPGGDAETRDQQRVERLVLGRPGAGKSVLAVGLAAGQAGSSTSAAAQPAAKGRAVR